MTTPTHTDARTIDESIECVRCGYDLKGLPLDGVCPECGVAAVQSVSPTPAGGLRRTGAPKPIPFEFVGRGVLQRLRLGFTMAAFGGLGWALGLYFPGPFVFQGPVLIGIAALSGLLWIGGLLVLAAPRPREGADASWFGPQSEWRGRRALMLATQALLPVAHMSLVLGGVFGSELLVGLYVVLMLAVAPGWSAVASYCSELAHWLSHSHASHSLQSTAVWLPVLGIVSVGAIVLTPITNILGLLIIAYLALIGFLVYFVIFLSRLTGLAMTAGWAIRNADEARAREARRLEKALAHKEEGPPGPTDDAPSSADEAFLAEFERRAAAAEQRDRSADPTDHDDDDHAPDPSAPKAGGHLPNIRRTEAETYGLEDDGEQPDRG